MIRTRVTMDTRGLVARFKAQSIQRLEQAALVATDRAAAGAHRDIRAAMSGSGLGRLGNAVGYGSDLKRSGNVFSRGKDRFSASGAIFLKSKSDRTVGAIVAYTEGATISPIKGQYLWIATREIPARAGRYRMTPALYNSSGLSTRIGPLIFIKGRHSGEALLVAKNVTVDRLGRSGRARRLPKRGAIGSTRQKQDQIVAFVGIRRTARTARVNVNTIVATYQAQLPALIAAELQKGG